MMAVSEYLIHVGMLSKKIAITGSKLQSFAHPSQPRTASGLKLDCLATCDKRYKRKPAKE